MKKLLIEILDQYNIPNDVKQKLYKVNITRQGLVAMNLKHRNLYNVIALSIDCTNDREGLINVVYVRNSSSVEVFTRELSEFMQKFILMEQ